MSNSVNFKQFLNPKPQPSPWYVNKIRLNQGGYDKYGNYWGYVDNLPLYICYNDSETLYFRAENRPHAIEQLRNAHQNKEIILLRP